MDLKKYVGNPDVASDEKLSIFRDGRPGPAAVCVGYVRSRRTVYCLAGSFSNPWVT
eukprot:COSAG02_NODE_942_length_15746_cov_6.164632_13_plen_56_part_00